MKMALMTRKYCCARLGIRHEVPREEGMNLRVIKKDPEFILDPNTEYRFFLTPGYKEGQQKALRYINIRYCPFCGTDLYVFYRSDVYVNERPGYF